MLKKNGKKWLLSFISSNFVKATRQFHWIIAPVDLKAGTGQGVRLGVTITDSAMQ